MKKIFTLTCLILATIIGAGFASGKEIQVFFTRYGKAGIVSIVLALALFFVVICVYLLFGKYGGFKSFFDSNRIMFGKYHKMANMMFFVSYLIVLAGMLAGVYEIYNMVLNPVLSKVLVLFTIVLCVIENSGGINNINFINNIFVPVTMFVLIIVAIICLNNIKIAMVDTGNLINSFTSVFLYVGINILLSGSMLIQEGCKYTFKQIILSAIFSSFILCLIILLFNFNLLSNQVGSSMPMLKLSFDTNNVVGYIALISIWFCIYSAITSFSFVLSCCIGDGEENLLSNIIVLTMAYIISLFGFTQIIEYLYPIIGVLGIIYSALIICKLKVLCKNVKNLEIKSVFTNKDK